MRMIASLFLSASLSVLTAGAAQAFDDDSYEVAQVRYERYIDEYGRTIFVDPYTDEVVRIIEPGVREARPRERRWRERQERRRARRLRQLERELTEVFGWDEEEEYRERFDDRPRRDDGGFFLDELDQPRQRSRPRAKPLPRAKPSKPRTTARRAPQVSPSAPKPNSDPQVASISPDEPLIQAAPKPVAKPKLSRETITKLQVFLDREGFSPGVIDGAWGSNVEKAIDAWKTARNEDADLSNPLVLDKIVNRPDFNAFTTYRITQADVTGPYAASIPSDYALKAQLPAMSYTSVVEKLAERFHMSEAHLRRLNPDADFNIAGTKLRVVATGANTKRDVHYIVADKAMKQVRAYDRNLGLVAAYPATIGSAQTPSPSGRVKIERIALDPNYTYNPKKNFQQGNNTKVLTIPPGPNGPVGTVWIALSKPTYGIHGTPNPELIGKTNSHGCIRLTNWDARELASLVKKGVTVEFTE